MTLDYSQTGDYQTIISEEINRIKLTNEGSFLFSIIESSNIDFKIEITEATYDPNSVFTGYNPLTNTVRISIDEVLNARAQEVFDNDISDEIEYRLGQSIFHELLHAVDLEYLSDGDYDHHNITPDPIISTTNEFVKQYGLLERDESTPSTRIIKSGEAEYEAPSVNKLTPTDPNYLSEHRLPLATTSPELNMTNEFFSNFYMKIFFNKDLTEAEQVIVAKEFLYTLDDDQKEEVIQEYGRLGSGSLSDYLDATVSAFQTSEVLLDPLAIDLDDSGDIETLAADSVYFDIDADGQAEAVSWISGNDGWLAIDTNANGKIDNVNELFGASGDGFADLAALDTNADGKIDFNDTQYDDLLVWQDANEDGITQDGELLSVADDLFIRELPIAPTTSTDENVTEAAVGQIHIEDMFLTVNETNTTNAEDITLDFDVIGLPELRGYGSVKNLSLAMSQDATLKADVQALAGETLTDLYGNFDMSLICAVREVHCSYPDFQRKV